MKEKKYSVIVPIRSVFGHQVYRIETNSEKDAIEKVKDGKGQMIEEDINIEDMDFNDASAYIE